MRQPKPFFRKQTRSWYVQIKGKWINLGADKDAAFETYHEMMAGRIDTDPRQQLCVRDTTGHGRSANANSADDRRVCYDCEAFSPVCRQAARCSLIATFR